MKFLILIFMLTGLTACSQEKTLTTIKKEHQLTDYNKLNEGVVIFDKDECSRCEQTILFCAENDIDFKLLNISESQDNAGLMWQLLEAVGYEEENVQTPVIIVRGKVTYNHEDLGEFLKALKG